MRKSLLVLSVLALSACSGEVTNAVNSDATPSNVRKETASYFSTSQSRVSVGNFGRGMLGTTYKARVSGKLYDCRYFKRAVTCQHAG